MIEMPASQRNAVGVAGRLKVEREFDEKLVIERYLEALSELFGPENRRGDSEVSEATKNATI